MAIDEYRDRLRARNEQARSGTCRWPTLRPQTRWLMMNGLRGTSRLADSGSRLIVTGLFVMMVLAFTASTDVAQASTVNRHFVFYGDSSGSFPTSGLFMANPDGSAAQSVPVGGYSYGPFALSADGRFITYPQRPCASFSARIRRLAPATTNARRSYTFIERAEARLSAEWPSRKDSAKRPATERAADCSSGAGLYIDDLRDPDGSNAHLLIADGQLGDWSYQWSGGVPTYSPDGSKLLVTASRQNTNASSPDYGTYEIDLMSVNVDGSGFSVLIRHMDNFVVPSFSPDGTKIVFDNDPTDTASLHGLFIANSDGSTVTGLTDPNAIGDASKPVFSPDGSKIAFVDRGYGSPDGNYGTNVWTINADGSDPTPITDGGNVAFSSVQWSPDGTRLLYEIRNYDGNYNNELASIPGEGPGVQTVLEGPTQNFTNAQDVAASPSGSASFVSDNQYLAAAFQPLLMLDSSEKWRPLNVAMFLSEQDPITGQPWNQVCSPSQGCTGLTGDSTLEQYPTSDSHIDIHHDPNAEDVQNTYTSPNPSCISTVGSTQVLDCGHGPASAIYYHVTGPSPGGYTYIDYWFFYRNDQGAFDVGKHAGDWEGVTVAPAADGSTFAFAEFSEHGHWESFLRDNLRCDDQGQGSCGTENQVDTTPAQPFYVGQHVMTFPAAGSHANYPQPGDTPLTDNGHDGTVSWARNWDPTTSVLGTCPSSVPSDTAGVCGPALIAFPATGAQDADWNTGPEQWTDWPGNWGATTGSTPDATSPCSPAGAYDPGRCGNDHAAHFFAPWSSDGNQDCPQDPQDQYGQPLPPGTACPAVRRTRSAMPLSCTNWFGDEVATLVCDQSSMRAALRSRRMTRRGGFALTLARHPGKAAAAPGLAQLIGPPLRPGGRAFLNGTLPPGTEIAVRANEGWRLDAGVFRQHERFRGLARLIVSRGRGGYPKVTVVEGKHRYVMTVTERRSIRPATRSRVR
jgi:Tol biopolymer transport system component